MKFIEISIHISVGIGLMLEGTLPGRSEIRRSFGIEGGNPIDSSKTHAYRFKFFVEIRDHWRSLMVASKWNGAK